MITGDHKVTATAIARQIGIFDDGDLAVDGVELDAMPDSELDEKLPRIAVYARVSPSIKSASFPLGSAAAASSP